MLALTLPDSITPDDARTIALVVVVAVVVLLVLVLRFVQKLLMKLTFAIVLVAVGAFAWHERDALAGCAKTCECRLAGIDVHIPREDLPPNPDVVCAD